jgi:Fe2+ transport system protein FeoA
VSAGYAPGTCRVRRGTAARGPPTPIAVATESQYHRRMVVDPPNRAAERRPLDRLPLTQLRRGDRAVMASADLSPEDRAMLHAMGLDERAEFTVCRAGRHGPCIIQLDATRLGLSPDLAAKILTRPCDCPDAGPCMGASDASDPGAPQGSPQGSPQTSPHANSTAPAATSPASAPTLPPNT